MKRLTTLFLVLCMLFTLTACGNIGKQSDEDEVITLGDIGVTVTIPAEMKFEAKESELNDFSGFAENGEWAIIANVDLKSDYPEYTLVEYASATSQANKGTIPGKDLNGNYYFTYTRDMGDGDIYKYYTAVLENETEYIRVAFYCFEAAWDTYRPQFKTWAETIELE